MLGLGDEVGGDTAGVRGRRGEDHALRGARRQVDADLARDLDLGGGDPGVAGADDPVDRGKTAVRQAVGERADGLCTSGDDERVDLEQAGGGEQDGVRAAVAVGGRGDDDPLDARDACRDDGHHERGRVGR